MSKHEESHHKKLFDFLWANADSYLTDGEKPVRVLPLPHGKGYLYLYEDGRYHQALARPTRLGYTKIHDWYDHYDHH